MPNQEAIRSWISKGAAGLAGLLAWPLLVCGNLNAAELLPGIGAALPEPGVPEGLAEAETASRQQAVRGRRLAERISSIRLEGWEGPAVWEAWGPGLEAEAGLLLPAPRMLAGRLAPWLGGVLDETGLMEIMDAVLSHYDRHGYPVVAIDAPQQDFRDARLVLKVEIGRIGRVGVTRPQHGRDELIREGLALREGAVLRRADLDRQMEWYGRSVFRRPRLFVSPGEAAASADILIGLEESRPWRVTTGYENSGPDLAGRDRWLVGAAGMTTGEHVVAWQTVLGMPVSSLQGHALSWEIPLHHWQQSIQLDAAYAEVATRIPGALGIFDNEGTSWSLAAMHKIILPRLGRWRQQLSGGFEVKGTDQFVLFGAGSFTPGEVRLFHGKAAYRMERNWDDAGAVIGGGVWVSPGGVFDGNDDADFRAYDPMADSGYVLGRLYGRGWWSPAGDWRVGLRGAAQWSDSRLLPSEQFAAGGHQTVRGAGEREVFADQGWHASLELMSPEWRATPWLGLRGLGFLDHAWLRDRGGASSSLTGAGFGVRLGLGEHLDLRADHGWRVDGRGGRTHVGVTMRY